MRASVVRLFQFHYGTIKSGEQRQHGGKHNNFNSTMVRLKASNGSTYIANKTISIPLWYD